MKERILNTLEDKKDEFSNNVEEMKSIINSDVIKHDRLSELCRSNTILLNEMEMLEGLITPEISIHN
nr:hypothetical protein [uncultured Draconibacterium sp.]